MHGNNMSGKRLRIESLESRDLLAVWTVNQHFDDGTGDSGTLSRAILNANANLVSDDVNLIRFQFLDPQNNNPYISITGPLPAITARYVTIDGTELQLTSADERVILDGNGVNADAIRYQGASNQAGHLIVQSIRIEDFDFDAIQIQSLSGDDRVTVTNTQLRSNRTGVSNGLSTGTGSGIHFQDMPWGATGKFTITDNVIFANGRDGIFIEDITGHIATPTATSTIERNRIGTSTNLSLQSNGRAGITLGAGAANIDVIDNDIYSANKAGIQLTTTAGNKNRISANPLTPAINVIRADTGGVAGAGLPIDLLADEVATPNDEGDVDSGPNGLQNKPTIQVGQIVENASAWNIPVRLDSQLGEYYLDVYIQNSVTKEWVFHHQSSVAFSSSTYTPIVSVPKSQAAAGDAVGIVAIGKSVNIHNTSEFATITLTRTANLSSAVLAAVSDTGVSNSDGITNHDNTSPAKSLQFVVSGTVPGATVTIYLFEAALGSVTATSSTTTVSIDSIHEIILGAPALSFRQALPGRLESAGVSTSLVVDNTAPRVTNVTISDSSSPSHLPFAFNIPGNEANDFDGSGIQLRTVPVGGADTVSIRFSEPMHTTGIGAIDVNSLTLVGLAFGNVPTPATSDPFSYDAVTNTATWRFEGALLADQYLISLADAATDAAGNALDGEWTNPFSVTTVNALVSEFPSGDGAPGGDFNFVMTILPGDYSLNNVVDGTDHNIWLDHEFWGGLFQQGDANGDGMVDGGDSVIFNANSGKDLRDLVFADFYPDGVIDMVDYNVYLEFEFFGTTHDTGDADGDGDVDGDDAEIWDRQFGLELDWVA